MEIISLEDYKGITDESNIDNSHKNNGRNIKRKSLNRLISSSFGMFVRGDFSKEVPPSGYFSFSSTQVQEELGYIGRVTFGKIPTHIKGCVPDIMLFGLGFQCYGKFLNQDGSSLKVYSQYLPHAQKYAQNYERRTGRKVTIVIDDTKDKLKW